MRKPFFYSIWEMAELIARASEWRGTPFLANARVMGLGVDCVQLVAAIYQATGFVDDFQPGAYAMDEGAHAERSRVVEYVEALKDADGVNKFELAWSRENGRQPEVAAGDLLCFRVGKQIHHVGLALSPVKFLHVYRGYKVKESPFNDPTWRKRLERIYRPVRAEMIPDPEPEVAPIAETPALPNEEPKIVWRPKIPECVPCLKRAEQLNA